MRCAYCDKTLGGDSFKTAYGDWLCEDCWDDYICSDVGRLEYLIGICFGDLPVDKFDADFLGEVVKSYMINHNKLNLTDEQKAKLEEKAKEFGLL